MKFAVAVLLGHVSAHHHKHHCEPLFGLLKQAKHCPKTDAKKLNHIEANRLFMKNMYFGWMKGVYQENHEIVDDQCFGDWMEPTFNTAWDLKKKAHDDFWSISIDEVKSVGSDLIDVVYKNMDACQFEKVGDDMKGWCLENPGQCIFMEGLEDRLFDNLFELIGEFMDLNKLFNKDDSCYSDMEVMGELYRFADDLGQITASLSGYDYKWDKTIERKHITKKAFHTQIKEALKEFKGKDPLQVMFPDLVEMFKGFDEMFKDMFPMHHHQTKNMHNKTITDDMMDKGEIHEDHATKKHHIQRFDPLGDLMSSLFFPPKHHQKAMPDMDKKEEVQMKLTHHQQWHFDPLGDFFKFLMNLFFPQHHQKTHKKFEIDEIYNTDKPEEPVHKMQHQQQHKKFDPLGDLFQNLFFPQQHHSKAMPDMNEHEEVNGHMQQHHQQWHFDPLGDFFKFLMNLFFPQHHQKTKTKSYKIDDMYNMDQPEEPVHTMQHQQQHKKFDPLGDLFFPQQKQQQWHFDPLGDFFKFLMSLFFPQHHTQQKQQIPQWGQMQMPQMQMPQMQIPQMQIPQLQIPQMQMPQFQQPQFDFNSFKLF